MWLLSGSSNKIKETDNSISKHADESHPFINHAKHMVRACFIFMYFS